MKKQTKVYDLEEGKELQLDFEKLSKVAAACSKIIPVAVQGADNRKVILIAHTNEEALKESIKTRIATL